MEETHMTQKDHDLLIEISTKLTMVIAEVADLKTNLSNRVGLIEMNYVEKKEFESHDSRITWLERIAYGGMGILAFIEFYFRILK